MARERLAMMTRLAVSGYRSIRELTLALGPLNIVTGANGSGKSSLYRSLRLLAEVAQGRLIASLAHDGGLPSVLWAGPETISRDMRAGRPPSRQLPSTHALAAGVRVRQLFVAGYPVGRSQLPNTYSRHLRRTAR